MTDAQQQDHLIFLQVFIIIIAAMVKLTIYLTSDTKSSDSPIFSSFYLILRKRSVTNRHLSEVEVS